MRLWKKLSKYLKGHEKWIEIKLPKIKRIREESDEGSEEE